MDISDVVTKQKNQEILQRSSCFFKFWYRQVEGKFEEIRFVSFLYAIQQHSSEKRWDLEVTFVPTCHSAFQIYLFPKLWILCLMEAFSSSWEDSGAKSQAVFTGCLLNCNQAPWNSLKVAPLTRRKFQPIPLKTENIARTPNITVSRGFCYCKKKKNLLFFFLQI